MRMHQHHPNTLVLEWTGCGLLCSHYIELEVKDEGKTVDDLIGFELMTGDTSSLTTSRRARGLAAARAAFSRAVRGSTKEERKSDMTTQLHVADD